LAVGEVPVNGQRKPTTRSARDWARVAIPLIAVGVAVVVPQSAHSETLDQELLHQAPRVLRYLNERGWRNVGVLKFRVQKGNERISDRVGPLNLNLATRLEIALVLADDVRKPVNIIRDASAVATKIPGANHLNQSGREALFRGRYPLAWGDQQVEADAFLTGVAILSPDLRQVKVEILGFGRNSPKMENIAEFTASTDPPVLVDVGESFMTRGAFEEGRVEIVPETVVKTAAKVKQSVEPHPLLDPSAPVGLEVFYDNRSVPLEIREGKAWVQEPQEVQKLLFVLRKRDKTLARYGVVLTVNGQNTLYKERVPPIACTKWILSEDYPAITVRGFQTREKTAEAFRILSAQESEANMMNYGADVGTISLVVFRELKSLRTSPSLLDEDAEDLAAVSRSRLPEKQPLNLAALKYQLRSGSGSNATRGLIVEGNKIDAAVRILTFTPDPTPVMAATITYYHP
jgi:hypothetical protein